MQRAADQLKRAGGKIVNYTKPHCLHMEGIQQIDVAEIPVYITDLYTRHYYFVITGPDSVTPRSRTMPDK